MTLHPVTDFDSAAPIGEIIVSRHAATIEWLRAEYPHLAAAPVLASATPADVAGRHVWGNVPLHLAAVSRTVYAIEFRGPAPRGAEYTIDDMRAAGVHVRRYTVYATDDLAAAVGAHSSDAVGEAIARRA